MPSCGIILVFHHSIFLPKNYKEITKTYNIAFRHNDKLQFINYRPNAGCPTNSDSKSWFVPSSLALIETNYGFSLGLNTEMPLQPPRYQAGNIERSRSGSIWLQLMLSWDTFPPLCPSKHYVKLPHSPCLGTKAIKV